MISKTERNRRERAVASSEGSLAIEGQTLDEATRELNRRYIAGELTFEQFSDAIDHHVAQLAKAIREQTLAIPA